MVLRCCGVAVLRCCGVAVLRRCCLLCAVCCVLCAVCCVLFGLVFVWLCLVLSYFVLSCVVCCLLSVVFCLLSVVRCSLFIVHCSLFVVRCSLFVVSVRALSVCMSTSPSHATSVAETNLQELITCVQLTTNASAPHLECRRLSINCNCGTSTGQHCLKPAPVDAQQRGLNNLAKELHRGISTVFTVTQLQCPTLSMN